MSAIKKQISARHFSLGQLRLDTWNALKNNCVKLADSETDEKSQDRTEERVHALLEDLMCIENYFAFPGNTRMGKLSQTLKRKEYTALAHSTIEITRTLVVSDTGNTTVHGHGDVIAKSR